MKYHLSNLAQILAGLLIAVAIGGMVLAVLLPWWLAQYVSAAMVTAFLVCLTGLVISVLLIAGMMLQKHEHNARIAAVLKAATRKASGRL